MLQLQANPFYLAGFVSLQQCHASMAAYGTIHRVLQHRVIQQLLHLGHVDDTPALSATETKFFC